MKFVLFRHAHKGSSPYDDPELSKQGQEQAASLVHLINRAEIPKPNQLLVSPRRRTSQTFYPVSREFNLQSKIQKALDQRNSNESHAEFRERVSQFLMQADQLESAGSVVYVCTHYDWIEEAMTLINCDKDLNSFEFSHWSPAQHLIFEVHEKLWKLIKKGKL